MSIQIRQAFWREAFALHGAIAPRVIARVLVFGVVALCVCEFVWLVESLFHQRFTLEVAPHELAGVALGVLLVMRTNAGYDRWWEARKLWGGFVDRCRNCCISAMCYGPNDPVWRDTFARWLAAYPHVARHSLRRERPSTEVANLLGQEYADRIATADHMPSLVALKLGELLNDVREQMGFAFLQVDRERALLIDNYGGCERILNTPLPRVYSVEIRQLIVMYLLTLPFALLHRLESDWIVPFITMLVAYPLLSLDQIGVELENPFARRNLSHLPIDDIAATIERNILEVLKAKQTNALARAIDP
jgi:ion channel-forming bestrophin family protein